MSENNARPAHANHHRSGLGPAWRLELATSWPRDVDRLDPLIGQLRQYLAAKADPHAARVAYPLVAGAADLQADTCLASNLMLMVLANLPLAEMAERTGQTPAQLELWEQIYFDCRDLREATCWLAAHVIEPAARNGDHKLASKQKLAIVAGPQAIRSLLDTEGGVPLDEAERLFARHVKLHVKIDVATNMVTSTPQDSVRFLKLYAANDLQMRRLKLAGEKLAQQCVARREKHERAKLQLELAHKREEQKAILRQNRATERQQRQATAAAAQIAAQRQAAKAKRAEEVRVANSPLKALRWKGKRKATAGERVSLAGDPEAGQKASGTTTSIGA